MESISDDSFSSVSLNLDSTEVEDSVTSKSNNDDMSDCTLMKLSLSESDSIFEEIKHKDKSMRLLTLASSYPTNRSSDIRKSNSDGASYGIRSTDETTVAQTDTLETPASSKIVRTLESSVQTSASAEESFSSSSEPEAADTKPKSPSLPSQHHKSMSNRSYTNVRKNNPPSLLSRDHLPPPILARESINSSDGIRRYANRFSAVTDTAISPRKVSLSRADEEDFETLDRFSNTIVRKGNYDVGQSPEGSKRINVPTNSDTLISRATEYFRDTARDIERRREVLPPHLRPQKKSAFKKTAHTFTTRNFMKDLVDI